MTAAAPGGHRGPLRQALAELRPVVDPAGHAQHQDARRDGDAAQLERGDHLASVADRRLKLMTEIGKWLRRAGLVRQQEGRTAGHPRPAHLIRRAGLTLRCGSMAVMVSPGNWLDRYRAGQRDEVWHELRQLGRAVREPGLFEEVQLVCDEMARRARHNVEVMPLRVLPQLGLQPRRIPRADIPRQPLATEAVPSPGTPASLNTRSITSEVPPTLPTSLPATRLATVGIARPTHTRSRARNARVGSGRGRNLVTHGPPLVRR
jgi:hypothetical protein